MPITKAAMNPASWSQAPYPEVPDFELEIAGS